MGVAGGLERRTTQAVFSVVAPVRPEAVDELRDVLAAIAADPAGNATLPFDALDDVHYASLVLHRGDPERPLLVFEANVDGTAESLLERLVEEAGDGVDAVWSHCVGYPGPGSPARFHYLRERLVLPSAYHVGTTGRSCRQILAEAELRRAVADVVDELRAAGTLPATSLGVREAIVDHIRNRPDLTWALAPSTREPVGERLRRTRFLVRSSDRRLVRPALVGGAVVLVAARRSPARAVLGSVAASAAVVGAFRWFEAREVAEDRPVPDELLGGIEAAENRPGAAVNHLASLVEIKRGRRGLLRAVLLVIDVAARVRYTKGQLGGIPSIHFAHWSVVDDGRRLLFVSNFDGSWESYLDDFIEKAASGLSAVWSNTANFPQARWLGVPRGTGGARHGPAFKRIARNSQSPTTVHHCAYPELSVTNILDNAALRRGVVGTMDEEQAWAWLSRL